MKRFMINAGLTMIRMTAVAVTVFVGCSLWYIMPDMCVAGGLIATIAGAIALAMVVMNEREETRQEQRYWGNQDHSSRQYGGTSQVTYKGR